MPKALEQRLKREASDKGLSGGRADAYVYGTLRKTGWKPKREMAKGGRVFDPDTLDFTGAEREHRLPSGLLRAMAQIESNMNPTAVSPRGAKGLMQFMDPTAKELGIDPLDPAQSVSGAGRYLRMLLDRYDGSMPKALAAYNWGLGNVDRYGMERLPNETTQYLQKLAGMLDGETADTESPPTPEPSYGVPIEPKQLAAEALPPDLPQVASAAQAGKLAGNPSPGAGGNPSMPGSPDTQEFDRFISSMLPQPAKGALEATGFAEGGPVDKRQIALIDRILGRLRAPASAPQPAPPPVVREGGRKRQLERAIDEALGKERYAEGGGVKRRVDRTLPQNRRGIDAIMDFLGLRNVVDSPTIGGVGDFGRGLKVGAEDVGYDLHSTYDVLDRMLSGEDERLPSFTTGPTRDPSAAENLGYNIGNVMSDPIGPMLGPIVKGARIAGRGLRRIPGNIGLGALGVMLLPHAASAKERPSLMSQIEDEQRAAERVMRMPASTTRGRFE